MEFWQYLIYNNLFLISEILKQESLVHLRNNIQDLKRAVLYIQAYVNDEIDSSNEQDTFYVSIISTSGMSRLCPVYVPGINYIQCQPEQTTDHIQYH